MDELRHATDVAVRLVGPRQKECLPRALTLFSLLTRHGYPAEFVSGVRRNGADLTGHAWVEMGGMPVEAPGASHASTGYRELIRIPSRVATGQGDQFLGEMG